MRNLVETGDRLNLVEDLLEEPPKLYNERCEALAALRQRYPQWATYSEMIRDGVIILEISGTSISADWNAWKRLWEVEPKVLQKYSI